MGRLKRPDQRKQPDRPGNHGSREIALGIWMALLLLGCGGSDNSASVRDDAARDATEAAPRDSASSAASTTDTDSAAVPDSLAATEEKTAEDKRGFLKRLFNREKEETKEEEPVPVELAEVRLCDLPSYLSATATLDPEKRAEILAKIDGEILRIETEEGDYVSTGQVLAILDGAVQRVALEECEARLHALDLDLQRIRALDEEQLASKKDLQDSRSAFDQAAAQRKSAQLMLDYTRIVAPFSGQITERFVDPGQTVAPGTPLFAIVDSDPLLARIYLPEKEAVKIVPGQGVVISPDTDPTLQARGEVLRIAPVVDSRTGTVKVTCRVSQRAVALRPGSFVRVKVETDVQQDVVVIPKRALVSEGADTYVFKAVADSVVKVGIVIGHSNRILVEVTEGLVVDERVVTVGHGALKTGCKIREIKRQPVPVADADSGRDAEG